MRAESKRILARYEKQNEYMKRNPISTINAPVNIAFLERAGSEVKSITEPTGIQITPKKNWIMPIT